MKRKSIDFKKGKIVFIDWIPIEAGVGNSKTYHLKEGKSNNGENIIQIEERNNFMPYGIELVNYKPVISKEPILKADKPWESGFIGVYVSLLQENDRIRMWYEAYPSSINLSKDDKTLFCYAESIDGGRTFVKPNLNLIKWNGISETNILFTPEMHFTKRGLHGTAVFKDKNPDCPKDEIYKTLYDTVGKDREKGNVFAATSPDGYKWKMYEEPVAETWADSQTRVEWDEDIQKYVGFFRSWHYNRRLIYYGETDDFFHWENLKPVIESDPTLPPDEDFYTNGYLKWPGTHNAYLLMPSVYRRTRDDLYVEMRGSRDRRNWYKYKVNPIIETKDMDEKFRGGVYLAHGLINYKGKWALPIGFPLQYHNQQRKKDAYIGEIYLAKWRKDGFTGIKVNELGEFWTLPSYFKGKRLFINGWTHNNGWIRVGLWDRLTRQPLPGLSIDNCIPITGLYSNDLNNPNYFEFQTKNDVRKLSNTKNDTRNNKEKNNKEIEELNPWHEVKWNSDEDLEDYDDVEVMIHFKIKRGALHAFKFE